MALSLTFAKFMCTCENIRQATRMWANAQRDGPQPNIGSALYESSVIPFLVPCHKAWLTPAAAVPCSNAANIGERKSWT